MNILTKSFITKNLSRRSIRLQRADYPRWHKTDFWLIFYQSGATDPRSMMSKKSFLELSNMAISQGIRSEEKLFFVDVSHKSQKLSLLFYPEKNAHALHSGLTHHGYPVKPPSDDSIFFYQHPIKNLGVYLSHDFLQRTPDEIAYFLSGFDHLVHSPKILTLLSTDENQQRVSELNMEDLQDHLDSYVESQSHQKSA